MDLSQFCNVTGASEEEARHYLEAFAGDCDEAVKAFFDAEGGEDSHQEVGTGLESGSNVGNSLPPAEPAVPNPSQSGASKIATIKSIQSKSVEGAEQGQAFYVGGSETGGGGQQVLGPPKRDTKKLTLDANESTDAFVHNLFQAAKGMGAEVLDSTQYNEKQNKPKRLPFSGTGCRLGEDPNAPTQLEPGTSSTQCAESESATEQNVVVKMWRDGFSLDDGPLRSYNDPDTREFFDDIQAGRVPQELIRAACGGLVNLMLEDHHHESWSAPPAPKIKPFSGTGQMLGHPAPRITRNEPVKPTVTETVNAPTVDESEAVTQIQVRLPDGERLVLRLNHSHTISDVRQAIISRRPDLASTPFNLLTIFPNRELTEDRQTLERAKLLNAALILRFA